MTVYDRTFNLPVVFTPQTFSNNLADVLAAHERNNLRLAETEKYAHVTYFFNGGREEEWPGELRVLVPSPRDVPSYDHKPEMSASEVTDRFVEALDAHEPAFAVLNFANPDMVGHTGSIPAAVKAVEGMSWESPRGPVRIEPGTRELTQNIYIRRVEKRDGRLANRIVETFPGVKAP